MSDLAICVENLSKLYHIGRLQGRHDTLRDALTDALRGPLNGLRRNGHAPRPLDDTIWALRDISFEVKRGEVLGVIGRNGAGKSTLLKILSRITEPTSGRAVIHGRGGSLLEVGTGFHPELTGRENIYLNGAILGMKRAEIERKFDEIVAFAEIEQFLDTPVKRYSSGMYVRLAFAVAAHLEPEILLVDEVLAVGDAQFQKKCLGKMGEVAHEGRTVLLVSHNMDAIARLCAKTLFLHRGGVAFLGEFSEAIGRYLAGNRQGGGMCYPIMTPSFRVDRIACFGGGQERAIVPWGPLTVEVDVTAVVPTRDIAVHLLVLGEDQQCILGFDSVDFGTVAKTTAGVKERFAFNIPQCPLPPGLYLLSLWVNSYSNQVYEHLDEMAELEVQQAPVYGNRVYDQRWHGRALAQASVTVKRVEN